jgi:Mg/Co/Ni transporter MgtE
MRDTLRRGPISKQPQERRKKMVTKNQVLSIIWNIGNELEICKDLTNQIILMSKIEDMVRKDTPADSPEMRDVFTRLDSEFNKTMLFDQDCSSINVDRLRLLLCRGEERTELGNDKDALEFFEHLALSKKLGRMFPGLNPGTLEDLSSLMCEGQVQDVFDLLEEEHMSTLLNEILGLENKTWRFLCCLADDQVRTLYDGLDDSDVICLLGELSWYQIRVFFSVLSQSQRLGLFTGLDNQMAENVLRSLSEDQRNELQESLEDV